MNEKKIRQQINVSFEGLRSESIFVKYTPIMVKILLVVTSFCLDRMFFVGRIENIKPMQ